VRNCLLVVVVVAFAALLPAAACSTTIPTVSFGPGYGFDATGLPECDLRNIGNVYYLLPGTRTCGSCPVGSSYVVCIGGMWDECVCEADIGCGNCPGYFDGGDDTISDSDGSDDPSSDTDGNGTPRDAGDGG
jgi:hypothetical protein